jgi:ABC-type uncharacterized transport system fused permease/ATPase subunit
MSMDDARTSDARQAARKEPFVRVRALKQRGISNVKWSSYSAFWASQIKQPGRVRWREFCAFALEFWTGETSRRAWTLTALVALCIALQLAAQLGVNEWNPKFFDALERKNVQSLGWATVLLPALVAFSGFAVSGALVARMTLQT